MITVSIINAILTRAGDLTAPKITPYLSIGGKYMILNIHGLYGRQYNTNYHALRELYPESEIISPQIDYVHTAPLEILDTLNSVPNIDLVVGCSFGGFFAYLLSAVRNIPCILVNPCIPPAEYIPDLVENYPAAYTEGSQRLFAQYYGTTDAYQIILGRSDPVISPARTQQLFDHDIYVIEGEHRLSGTVFRECFRKAVRKARREDGNASMEGAAYEKKYQK